MLSIQNLCKRYRNGVQALDNVSLQIPTGMFGLLGPNGAGKSTLMRTLATLQEADSGTAFLDDLDVLKDKETVRGILGYLPQEFGLDPRVSALRMLNHFAALKGVQSSGERTDLVEYLLQKTNLYDVRKRRLGEFSGGMKQRFGIAVALLGNPKLIIVDEPTAGLDPEERVRFLNLLSELGENIVVILSTHIVSDVTDLCQQMAIIHRGRVIMSGKTSRMAVNFQNKVWKATVPRTELATFEQNHRVISTRLNAGHFQVRVFSDNRPGAAFEPVEVDLDDIYFIGIKGHDVNGPQPALV